MNVALFIFSLRYGSQNYVGISLISYIFYFQTILFLTIIASVYLGIMIGILIIVLITFIIKFLLALYIFLLLVYLLLRVSCSKRRNPGLSVAGSSSSSSENQVKDPYFRTTNLNTTGLLSTEESDQESHDTCLICLETYKSTDIIIYFPCHTTHNFHQKCSLQWLKNSQTCPVCRYNV